MKILGLDLGVASIGWAIVDVPQDNAANQEISIEGIGCLLINNSSETLREFQKGVGMNANTTRKILRSQRNRNRHAKARRSKLTSFLNQYGMTPTAMTEDKMRLWQLRASASSQRLELEDLGRVLIHLSKRRGHVTGTKVPEGKTIGEYVYEQLCMDANFRAKGLEFSRAEHIRELETIIRSQREHYPQILTRDNSYSLIHRIIFLDKRHKDKAATKRLCELETREYLESLYPNPDKTNKGAKRYSPCAALRSNPLYQNFNTLTQLQQVRIYTGAGFDVEPRSLTVEEQNYLFNCLQHSESISLKEIPALLDLGPDARCRTVLPPSDLPIKISSYRRKITGNQTYAQLRQILGAKYEHLLRFDIQSANELSSLDGSASTCQDANVKNGISNGKLFQPHNASSPLSFIDDSILEQPLYILWREIFSLRDKKALEKVLRNKYYIYEQEILDKLCTINLYSFGFSNISIKAIRKLMPLMLQGASLMEACQRAGYTKQESEHLDNNGFQSDALNKTHLNQNNQDGVISHRGEPTNIYTEAGLSINKDSVLDSDTEELAILKQTISKQGISSTGCTEQKFMQPLTGPKITNPVVQKVLNKLVTLVNRLLKQYGSFDSIHVEMARELWMSAAQRQKYYLQIQRNQQDYLRYTKKLQSMGVLVSQKALLKFKIWEDSDGCCVYCGRKVPLKEYLTGKDGEIEHIIPRSMQFNDSLNNKVCACRRCNQAKGSTTAYDFIESQGQEALKEFKVRVDSLYGKKKISKEKHDNLLTKATDLSDEFISSQLVASRYITSKALEMLSEVCPEIIPTYGLFTSFLRAKWGYDTVLHDLNLPYYRAISKVESRTPLIDEDTEAKAENIVDKTAKTGEVTDENRYSATERIQG